MNGAFPYPFLDKLNFPSGPAGVVGATIVVFYLVGRLGALLSYASGSLRHASTPPPQLATNGESHKSK